MFRKCILLSASGILLLFIGCAASHYSQGEKSLDREDYDAAILAFEKALEEKPDDPVIERELGIAHYSKPDMDKAIPLLLKSFLKDSADGRTLFYLGTAFEIQGDIPYAIDIYRRYTGVSRSEDIRASIESRMLQLIEKQMEADAKTALAQEKMIDVSSIPDTSLAVTYFRNMGGRKDLDPIQKGLAEMVITDLSRLKRLKVIERLRMQKLFEEMGLGTSGVINESSAPRAARLMGAARLINGTFIDLKGEGLRIDAKILDTRKASFQKPSNVTGKLPEIFRMEKDLVFKLLSQMNIPLTQEERDAIAVIPTENLLAFMAYCRGLDFDDRGMYQDAAREYRNAVELDPNFSAASQQLSRSETLSGGELGMEELQTQFVSSGDAGIEEETSPAGADAVSRVSDAAGTELSPVVDRLISTGDILNSGFLPGIDNRKPAQEQTQSSFGQSAAFEIIIPLPRR